MSFDAATMRLLITSRRRGEIQLLLGPMCSGKTSELLARATRYFLQPTECILFKPKLDTRDGADVAIVRSRDGKKLEAVVVQSLMAQCETCARFRVILIDEGQFFLDVVEFAETMANAGKIVIIAALNGDFTRKPLCLTPDHRCVSELVALCDEIKHFRGVCQGHQHCPRCPEEGWFRCGEDASFTRRMTADTNVVAIGDDQYLTVCRSCYFYDCQKAEPRAAYLAVLQKLSASLSPRDGVSLQLHPSIV